MRARCSICGHRFRFVMRNGFRAREKHWWLDVPANGGIHAEPPYVCHWCDERTDPRPQWKRDMDDEIRADQAAGIEYDRQRREDRNREESER